MINFRFHLVSLVAVFLAIGLGILVGSTVIDQSIVDRLDREIDNVRNENRTRKAEGEALARRNAEQQEYIERAAPFVVDGRLDGQSVAVIAERGVDGDVVTQTEALLRGAGADVPAILWLDDPWLLDTDQRITDLQSALGVRGDEDEMRARALDLFAQRLAKAPTVRSTSTTTARSTTPGGATTTSTPAPPPVDVLAELDDAGFISATDGDVADFGNFPVRAAHVLVITGDNSHFHGAGITPAFAHALTRAGVPAVFAAVYDEGNDSANVPERGATLAPVIDDSVLSQAVSTVDDLELVQGRVAATLALEVVASGAVGHYGYGPEASAPTPTHPSSGQ